MQENYIQEKPPTPPYVIKDKFVHISLEGVELEGNLTIPRNAKGIVVFAHGSGSSRNSPRNRYVAGVLNEYGLGTLLTDLLTSEEDAVDMETRQLRFNIPMLAERLEGIANWIRKEPQIKELNIGYFGSSTGGGAAIIASAKLAETIKAIVSRGGRPDLAGESSLSRVTAPILLIVGERDTQVLKLNTQTLKYLNKQSMLEIIPRASHLFEEANTLEEVAHMAASWFKKYLE